MMGRSRIHWLRRALIRVAMWGDPAAKLPDDLSEGRRVFEDAKNGSLESAIALERAWFAYCYLRGSHKPLTSPHDPSIRDTPNGQ